MVIGYYLNGLNFKNKNEPVLTKDLIYTYTKYFNSISPEKIV